MSKTIQEYSAPKSDTTHAFQQNIAVSKWKSIFTRFLVFLVNSMKSENCVFESLKIINFSISIKPTFLLAMFLREALFTFVGWSKLDVTVRPHAERTTSKRIIIQPTRGGTCRSTVQSLSELYFSPVHCFLRFSINKHKLKKQNKYLRIKY